ncbi:MAG TPA: hypothetical protein VF100_08295, partial [Thermoanaerobaculia bacterium]
MRRSRIVAAVLCSIALTAAGCRTLPPAPPCDCALALAGETPSCPPLDLAGLGGQAGAGGGAGR